MIYRVFCCSDTHGHLPALPDRVVTPYDATLHAGDIYNGAELMQGETSNDAVAGWIDPEAAALTRWIESAAPVHVVRGNHDLADPHRFFARSCEVTGRVERLNAGIVLAGLGWHGERYYELPREAEMSVPVAGVRHQLRRV